MYRRNRRVRDDVGVMYDADSTATAPAVSPSAFVDLYERSVTQVYSYFASRVGDRATAEDLTQDVFVVGAQRAATGLVVDLGWLIGVARHKLVDHWRVRAREGRKLALAHSQEHTRAVENPVSVDPDRAAEVLVRLNPTYRAALVLRHVDGLSVPAVADHLGRTVEATEQVLAWARAAFRNIYQGASGE